MISQGEKRMWSILVCTRVLWALATAETLVKVNNKYKRSLCRSLYGTWKRPTAFCQVCAVQPTCERSRGGLVPSFGLNSRMCWVKFGRALFTYFTVAFTNFAIGCKLHSVKCSCWLLALKWLVRQFYRKYSPVFKTRNRPWTDLYTQHLRVPLTE
jgi:hypothetical protein